jgi:hypothetical protein
MQLTMMGVLTLKAAGSKNAHFALYPQNGWSMYAKMVLGTAPLLFFTYFVYDILRKAYEKQTKNIPFEVLGRAHNNERTVIVEETEFLVNQKRVVFSSGSFPNLSKQESFPADTTISMAEEESSTAAAHINRRRPSNQETGPRSSSTPYLHPSNPSRSLLDPTPTSASPFQEQFEIDEPTRDYLPLEQDDPSLLQNAEPPMTKVSGILDPPITSSSKDEYLNPKTDVQLYSYLHPCLIGKLPVAWLPFEPFDNLRKKQYEDQLLLLKRYTYRQLQEDDVPLVAVRVGRMRRFMDGFSSFMHYTLS